MSWGAGWLASSMPEPFRSNGFNASLDKHTFAAGAAPPAGLYDLWLLSSWAMPRCR